MNLKYAGILTAFAVSAVMAQNTAPAAETAAPAPAPVAEVAPVQAEPIVEQASAQTEDKFTQAEKELAPENLFSEPTAVRGADAAKPVQKKTTKKFVYRPVYSPAEIEPSRSNVKTIYVSEVASADTIDMDQLRGRLPLVLLRHPLVVKHQPGPRIQRVPSLVCFARQLLHAAIIPPLYLRFITSVCAGAPRGSSRPPPTPRLWSPIPASR